MARGRMFTRELKLDLMRQLASGEKRPAQLCREHGLGESLLWRWRREYAERGEAAFSAHEPGERQALERRVAELERFCGQLALENAALKKGLSLAALRHGRR